MSLTVLRVNHSKEHMKHMKPRSSTQPSEYDSSRFAPVVDSAGWTVAWVSIVPFREAALMR